MFTKSKLFTRLTFLGIFVAVVGANTSARAENCVPLPVVGGLGSSVTKKVSLPTIPAGALGMLGIDLTHNNWNTDWAVSGTAHFRRYVVIVSSPDGGPFNIRMYLKYSNQTSSKFFDQKGVKINPSQPLRLVGYPRPGNQPYQVNLFLNGMDSLSKTFKAQAIGCY